MTKGQTKQTPSFFLLSLARTAVVDPPRLCTNYSDMTFKLFKGRRAYFGLVKLNNLPFGWQPQLRSTSTYSGSLQIHYHRFGINEPYYGVHSITIGSSKYPGTVALGVTFQFSG
jgi:hypothetical protein